jgi:hypothetical protein
LSAGALPFQPKGFTLSAKASAFAPQRIAEDNADEDEDDMDVAPGNTSSPSSPSSSSSSPSSDPLDLDESHELFSRLRRLEISGRVRVALDLVVPAQFHRFLVGPQASILKKLQKVSFSKKICVLF